jgi:hypothetical protein
MTYRVYITDEFEVEASDIYNAQSLALIHLGDGGETPSIATTPTKVVHVCHSVSANCFIHQGQIEASRERRRLHRVGRSSRRNLGQDDPDPDPDLGSGGKL